MSPLFSNQKHTISPRRARRGALLPAALFGAIITSVVLSSYARHILNEFRTTRAVEAASHIADIAKDFDNYVFENQTSLIASMSANTVRALTSTESGLSGFQGQIRDHRTVTPRGYTLSYYIGNFDSEVGPVGYILYTAVDTYEASYIDQIVRELSERDINAGSSDGKNNIAFDDAVIEAKTAVEIALARPLLATERAVFTPAISGINTRFILRTNRAGIDAHEIDLSAANAGQDVMDFTNNNIATIDGLEVGNVGTAISPVTVTSSQIEATSLNAVQSGTPPSGFSYVGPIGGTSEFTVTGNATLSGQADTEDADITDLQTVTLTGTGDHNYVTLNVSGAVAALSGAKAEDVIVGESQGSISQVQTFEVAADALAISNTLTADDLSASAANLNAITVTSECFGC